MAAVEEGIWQPKRERWGRVKERRGERRKGEGRRGEKQRVIKNLRQGREE